MDSLWRDATTDGWELLSGEEMLEKQQPGSPLRGREPDQLLKNDEVLLLARICQPGDDATADSGLWVSVTGRRDGGFIGTVVREPNAYAPALGRGQQVHFLAEHVASVRTPDPT